MKPKVSIVTPVYNSAQFIQSTIESVLSQTYTHWELILVDDGSTDKSLQRIEPFLQHDQIKLIAFKKNKGVAIARNEGTKHASGSYIAFLDSDDLWLPNKLETQINLMLEANIDVCFSSYSLMDEKGKLLNKTMMALPKLCYKKLIKSNYIGNLTGIYNAETLGKILVPNLRKRQDWLLWLQALKKAPKPAVGIQEPLAVYRVRSQSVSSNKMALIKYNYWVYKKGLGFSTIKSIGCLMRFFIEQFFIKPQQMVTSKTT